MDKYSCNRCKKKGRMVCIHNFSSVKHLEINYDKGLLI